MPTRIPLKSTVVRKDPVSLPAPSGRSRNNGSHGTASAAAVSTRSNIIPSLHHQPDATTPSPNRNILRSGSVYHRSSILRERIGGRQSSRDEDDEDDDDDDDNNDTMLDSNSIPRLSSNDIRASPRVLGYMFSSIAAIVMFVSIIQ